MKKLLFILLFVASECNAEELTDGWRYLKEVWAEELLVGAEYGHSPTVCIRWGKSPTLSVCRPSESQKQIVSNAVKELNQALSRTKVQIKLCEDNTFADISVEFVDKETFKKQAGHYLGQFYDELNGFVSVKSDKSFNIKKAVVFLNKDALKDDEMIHVVYEEITQSLGILNDSWHYEDSIFYQGRSFTTSLSFLDKQLICFFYFYIEPGDTKDTVVKKFKQNFKSIKADWVE
jgi:hypothetical protein